MTEPAATEPAPTEPAPSGAGLSARGLDEQALRRIFGAFPTGVVAIAAQVDGRPIGIAASSFLAVSLSPPLVSVCVSNSSTTWTRLREHGRLGLSVLAEHQAAASHQLAGPEHGRFDGLDVTVADDGEVLLGGASAWFRCILADELAAGDHQIALLRIVEASLDDKAPPLVFHRSSYRRLDLASPAPGGPAAP